MSTDSKRRPLLVGICGGSSSGKSTLGNTLLAALGPQRASLISFDSYYRDLGHLPQAQRARCNFDHPSSLDTERFVRDLDELRSGRGARVPVYDFATHTRSATETQPVPAREVVLVDGILLLCFDAVVERLDDSFFLSVAPEVRLRRRIARDIVERGRTEEGVRRQWAETVQPMHERYVQGFAHRARHQLAGSFDPEAVAAAWLAERGLAVRAQPDPGSGT